MLLAGLIVVFHGFQLAVLSDYSPIIFQETVLMLFKQEGQEQLSAISPRNGTDPSFFRGSYLRLEGALTIGAIDEGKSKIKSYAFAMSSKAKLTTEEKDDFDILPFQPLLGTLKSTGAVRGIDLPTVSIPSFSGKTWECVSFSRTGI